MSVSMMVKTLYRTDWTKAFIFTCEKRLLEVSIAVKRVLGIIAIRSDDDRSLCGRKRTERNEALQSWDDGLGVL